MVCQAAEAHDEDAAPVVADFLSVNARIAKPGSGHTILFQVGYKGSVEFVRLEHFAVVGIEARTSNAREMTSEGSIGKIWERFRRQNLAEKIPNRADSNIIAVYTDYASDEHGDYTYLLGAKVTAVAETPEGMSVRNVPTGRYAIFSSARGAVPKVVIEAWQRIWVEPRTAEYSRNYRTDFERYGTESADPANSRVDIYIGVRD